MLHVVSGDAGAARLQEAGFLGRVAVQRDSPAVGPWSVDPEKCQALRAAFWGDPHATPVVSVDPRPGEAVQLHFTSEPWDQLAQVAVLAALDAQPHPIHLVTEAGPLDPGDLTEALALYDRIAAQDWRGLEAHLPDILPSLPFLRPALQRVLEDHPAQGEGRTLRQIRELVKEGATEVEALMPRLAALERPWGVAWYGDRYVAKLLATLP